MFKVISILLWIGGGVAYLVGAGIKMGGGEIWVFVGGAVALVFAVFMSWGHSAGSAKGVKVASDNEILMKAIKAIAGPQDITIKPREYNADDAVKMRLIAQRALADLDEEQDEV